MSVCLCGCGERVRFMWEHINARSQAILVIHDFALRVGELCTTPDPSPQAVSEATVVRENLLGSAHNCRNFSVLLHDASIGRLTVLQVNSELARFTGSLETPGSGSLPSELDSVPINEGLRHLVLLAIGVFQGGVESGLRTNQDLQDEIDAVESGVKKFSGTDALSFSLDAREAISRTSGEARPVSD